MANGMMLGAVYDALVEAGASPEKSRQAAEAVASYGERVGVIERDVTERTSGLRGDVSELRSELRQELSDFRGEVNTRFAKIDGEMTLMKWMIGFVIATNVALLARLFTS